MSAPAKTKKPQRFRIPAPIVSIECPLCGTDISDGGMGADCYRCRVSWSFLDGPGQPLDRAAEQCPSEIKRPDQDSASRCILSVGHKHDHRGVAITDDGSEDEHVDAGGVDEWSDADAAKHPNDQPPEYRGQTFLIGDPEPSEVGVVRDRDETRWTRDRDSDAGTWRTDSGDPLTWPELLVMWGPATAVAS